MIPFLWGTFMRQASLLSRHMTKDGGSISVFNTQQLLQDSCDLVETCLDVANDTCPLLPRLSREVEVGAKDVCGIVGENPRLDQNPAGPPISSGGVVCLVICSPWMSISSQHVGWEAREPCRRK